MPVPSSEQSTYRDALPLRCSVISAWVYMEVLEIGAGQERCSTTWIQRLFPRQQARALRCFGPRSLSSHDPHGPRLISHQPLRESQCCFLHCVCFNPSASSCLSPPPIPPWRSMASALPLQDITGSRMPSFSSSLKTYDGTLSFLANQEEHVLVSFSPRGP